MTDEKRQIIIQSLQVAAEEHEREARRLKSLISYIRHPHGG